MPEMQNRDIIGAFTKAEMFGNHISFYVNVVSVNNIITINGLNVSHGQFTHLYDVEEITDLKCRRFSHVTMHAYYLNSRCLLHVYCLMYIIHNSFPTPAHSISPCKKNDVNKNERNKIVFYSSLWVHSANRHF